MTTTVYYPPLSRIIRAEAIPGEFHTIENLVQDGIDIVLGKVLYKDYVSQISYDGTQQYHSLTLLTKELKLPIPGTGMNLIFFYGEQTNFSEFQIIFDWRWEAQKYISAIEDGGFSALPEAFVGVFLDLIDVESEKEFIGQIVNTFLDDGSDLYLNYFNTLKTQVGGLYSGADVGIIGEITNLTTQLDNILAEVHTLLTSTNLYTILGLFESYEGNPTLLTAVNSAISSIEKLEDDFDITIDIFEELIQAAIGEFSDIDEKFQRLANLFQSWFDGITKQDIYDLAVPQFTLSLTDIDAALEFPRNWLIPALQSANTTPGPNDFLDGDGKIYALDNDGHFQEDPTWQSALVFTVGSLDLSSKNGFEFHNQSSFSFSRSFIGNTGIMLAFDDLKLDFSKTSNIPEADADGRPEDFMGMYARSASVTLPAKWFSDHPSGPNAEIFAERLLVGSGGFSGELGLRPVGGDGRFWASIGGDSGFEVGFTSFDISFKQNKVIESNILGGLKVPKFTYPSGHPNAGQFVEIEIAGHIHDDGDFYLTASAAPPYPIAFENVFTYEIASLEFGKEDQNFYLGTSGKLQFEGFLKNVLKLDAIEVEKLRIYETGKIEFEGGSLNLIEPIVLPLGPVEMTVTAIHYGSHQREIDGRLWKFNYFGFDGGISIDPLGIEVSGKGVKFYYCTEDDTNKPQPYLHIQTLHLDLTIPANSPAVVFKGWLSIPEPGTSPEYAGGIDLKIPQAKIAAKADMKLMPRYPAFIIDAQVDLPAPIPIGPVGIYALRGLIGYRYVAEKEAVGLVSGVDTWYDYYKFPPQGIHVNKFNGPDKSKLAGTPFSVGLGASLGTSADNGTILNIRAMILLSIPSLFMIEGRLAIISARLGLEETDKEPFFAFIAIGDNSLEMGFGADFKMPTKSGDILDLYVEAGAYFDFKDSSKWYINLGTKTNPTTAKIIKVLTIKSYLMLSAKGIEAGARGEFSFLREYGPIRVSAWAYIELGGKISFESPQFGAYMAAGVGADVDIKIVRLYAAFDMLLGVEGAKPFKIYGEFHVCVSVRILFFKFEYCGDLELVWEFNKTVIRSPLNPLLSANSTLNFSDMAKGVSMLSNETFDLAHFQGNAAPTAVPTSFKQHILPLDTYIDFKSEKGLIPNAVSSVIGGVTNPAARYTDLIPPQKFIKGKEVRQVKHQYSVTDVELKSWNPTTNSWQEYNPWKALYPADSSLNYLRAGQFQKSDDQYNKIRFLATSPFSYTEQGMPGWFVPEQNGLNPGGIFCQGEERVKKCANFLDKSIGQNYFCTDSNQLFYSNEAAFMLLDHKNGEAAKVVTRSNPFGFTRSLQIDNRHRIQIRLPEPSVEVDLKLSGDAQSVEIKYYASVLDDDAIVVTYRHPDPTSTTPTEPFCVTVLRADFTQTIEYSEPNWLPVTRVEINPVTPDEALINSLQEQINAIDHQNFRVAVGIANGEIRNPEPLQEQLEELHDAACADHNPEYKFAVRFSDPEIEIVATKRFSEAGEDFSYAIGYSETGPVILKSSLQGHLIWSRKISVANKAPIKLLDIIQLRSADQYVISGTDGADQFLFSIDVYGDPVWQKRIFANSDDTPSFLLQSTEKNGFYLIYTDRLNMGILSPIGKEFSATGQIVNDRRLEFPSLGRQSINVRSARIDAESIVIALQYTQNIQKRSKLLPVPVKVYSPKPNPAKPTQISKLIRAQKLDFGQENSLSQVTRNSNVSSREATTQTIESLNIQTNQAASSPTEISGLQRLIPPHNFWPRSGAIIVELRKNLRGKTANFYPNLYLNDMIDFGPDDYIFTAYDSRQKKTVAVRHGQGGLSHGVILGGEASDNTILSVGNDDSFYLCYHSGTKQILHLISKSFSFISSKEVRQDDFQPKIQRIEHHALSNTLALSFSSPPIMALVGHNLDLCFLKDTELPSLEPSRFDFARLAIKTTMSETRSGGLEARWENIHPHRKTICHESPSDLACSTLLHEVCWMSLEDEQYNTLIPGQAAISEDTEATIAGMTQHIQPIWRPDTSYLIKVTLQDKVDDNSSNIGTYNCFLGFSTVGPLGYFHSHDDVDYGDPDYPDQSPLTRLTRYIDYNRSYPNADGDLLGAKPLFYDSPLTKIDLFFEKAWARHFFHEWAAYNGQSAIAGRIKIVLKDPVEGDEIENPPYLDFDPADTLHISTPQTVETWVDDPDPIIPPIYQQYQNLLASQNCVLFGGQTIKPKSEYLQTFPKNLKPNKLYTAIVNNLFDINRDGDFDVPSQVVPSGFESEMREVHNFVFKTSRYPDFSDQVNSFYLEEIIDGVIQSRPAIYPMDKGFTGAEIDAAYACFTGGANIMADEIETQFLHKFDRVVEGIFALDPLPSCQTTEINVIRDSNDNDKIIALLIRNPEPFNNPRLPLDVIQPTVEVVKNNGSIQAGYHKLFSKDYSQILIMHNSLEIIGPVNIRFQYKLYNGSTFVVPATGTVVLNNLDIANV